MGSICRSSAPILRCSALTRTQSVIFIIPAALEVIGTTSLIFLKWGSGNRHLLLTAEGWFYFILALLELLSNILPPVRERLSLFRAFDVGIGVASFLPLFFYTFFLYLFTKSELIETLPTTVRNVAKLTLISFVPAVAISNEVASFVGVSIRNSLAPSSPDSVIIIGFTSRQQEGLWTFFTSLTLALLVVSQATVFCFAFFRITQALLHQRRLQRRGEKVEGMVKGTGWVAGAMKLGAIETVIGFAGGAFGIILARRIVRAIARVCLCVGLVKGVDVIEDFEAVRSSSISKKPKSFRRSDLRAFISNPRQSTFRQLSPHATDFHARPRAPHYVLKRETFDKQLSTFSEKGRKADMELFASIRDTQKRQRVTVLFGNGAPTLHMRFSDLDIPSPAVISRGIKKAYPDWDLFLSRSATSASSKDTVQDAYKKLEGGYLPPPPRLGGGHRLSTPLTDTSRDSFISSAAEIVVGPRQIVKPARAAMIDTTVSRSDFSTASPLDGSPTLQVNSTPSEPSRWLSQRSTRRGTTATGRSRSDSQALTIRSGTDSIQAVRELAPQFPGPPLSSWKEEGFGAAAGAVGPRSGRSSWVAGNPSSPPTPTARGAEYPKSSTYGPTLPSQGLESPSEPTYQRGSPPLPPTPPGVVPDEQLGKGYPSPTARAATTQQDVVTEPGNINNNNANQNTSSNGSDESDSPVVFASTERGDSGGRNGNGVDGGGTGDMESQRDSDALTIVPGPSRLVQVSTPKIDADATVTSMKATNPSADSGPLSSLPLSPDSVIDPFRGDAVGKEKAAAVRASRAASGHAGGFASAPRTPMSSSTVPPLPRKGNYRLESKPSVSASSPSAPTPPTIFTGFTIRTPTSTDVVTVTPATDTDFIDLASAKSGGFPAANGGGPLRPGSAVGHGNQHTFGGRQRGVDGSGGDDDVVSESHESSAGTSEQLSPDSEKRAMVSRWVDNTNTSTSPSNASITAVRYFDVAQPPPATRTGISQQKLHERGTSIDNLAIQWGGRAVAQKSGVSRLKSVGQVAHRSTPPIQAGHAIRGSLHLERLTIPPPTANRPIAVQGITEGQEDEVEHGSPSSGSTGKVLKDAEVLEMEYGEASTNRF